MAKRRLSEEKVSILETAASLGRDGISVPGNYRQKKKLIKQLAQESPDAFAGAPDHWF